MLDPNLCHTNVIGYTSLKQLANEEVEGYDKIGCYVNGLRFNGT